MNIVEIITGDYQRFPENQTYSIYAENVYFQDPVNKFTGIVKYQEMIKFFQRWFLDIKLDLHDINQKDDVIITKWTLNWTSPMFWKPRISITGWSELKLNDQGLICSHIDYWECSIFDVVKQNFSFF
jgi:Uncharacterized conserved protein (DUF2358)